MSIDRLRQIWQREFGRKAPTHLGRSLLHRLLLYRMQVDTFGGLPANLARQLDRIAQEESNTSGAIPSPEKGKLRVGTVLVREHSGIQNRVVVTQAGFLWDGREFDSLSQVARAITGTRWNGRRFFGLRGGSSAKA